jgi:hypothetical protein
MLKQAVRNCSGVEYQNITTAHLLKELVPRNRYGEILEQKMINYAITLGPPLVFKSQILNRFATCSGPLQQTINPSNYEPILYSPIAIHIETKAFSGGREYGEVQPSICAMAYFNRLRLLAENPVSITLPLFLVSGESWNLFFAWDLEG